MTRIPTAPELRSEPEPTTTGRAATPKTDAMRHLAGEWKEMADEKVSHYLRDGIAWKTASYLLLVATASAAAGGGAALTGSPRAAAVLAFVAAGAGAGSGPAAREVARQRTKKVTWRQLIRKLEVFLEVRVDHETEDAVDAAFADLETAMQAAEAADQGDCI